VVVLESGLRLAPGYRALRRLSCDPLVDCALLSQEVLFHLFNEFLLLLVLEKHRQVGCRVEHVSLMLLQHELLLLLQQAVLLSQQLAGHDHLVDQVA